MWLRVTGDRQWTIADHEVRGSEQEAEYVRLYTEKDAPPPRSGHWTGVEMQQLRYLLAAMTGRTLEEVTEPASKLCHALRYGPNRNALLSAREADQCPYCTAEDPEIDDQGKCMECGRYIPTLREIMGYRTEDTPGMVVTDLGDWEYEGEDGG
jgi:hypothetical protein